MNRRPNAYTVHVVMEWIKCERRQSTKQSDQQDMGYDSA